MFEVAVSNPSIYLSIFFFFPLDHVCVSFFLHMLQWEDAAIPVSLLGIFDGCACKCVRLVKPFKLGFKDHP
jgi:hypothetical protein